MNPFLFDGHLDHEYRTLRDSSSSILPASSLLLPPHPSSSLPNSTTPFHHHQQQQHQPSVFESSAMEDMIQSTWTIRPNEQQHEQMGRVGVEEEGGGSSSFERFESLGSLNARHRSLLRELIDRQDCEYMATILGGGAEDQSLRHATELQALLVELSEQKQFVLGGLAARGTQTNGSGLQAFFDSGISRSESWSFLASDNTGPFTANGQQYATSTSCFSDSDEGVSQSNPSSRHTRGSFSDMETSGSSSWSTNGDTSWLDQYMGSQSTSGGQGLVFEPESMIAAHDDDLLFDIESDGRYNMLGVSSAATFSPKPLTQTSPAATTKTGREPRVAFSCDDCARMKKPCKKPLGPDGRINPIGDCVRCVNSSARYGRPVHCTYLKSQDRILKSKHIHGLREDSYTPDVG